MRKRLIAGILARLSDVCSFTSVAREVNLSVSTVIRVFDCINYGKPRNLPEVVSIDEFKGNTSTEKYQCILTDPAHHRILDILPNRYSHHLTAYFKQLDRSQTKHFVSDMWATYADIAQTYFENSVYVIDKYHFIRQVFWAFEAIPEEEQKKFSKTRRIYFKHSRTSLNRRYQFLSPEQKQQVDLMLYTSSRLLTAYSLKELFFHVLDARDSDSARILLSRWIMAAQNSDLSNVIACGNTMIRWSLAFSTHSTALIPTALPKGLTTRSRSSNAILMATAIFAIFAIVSCICSIIQRKKEQLDATPLSFHFGLPQLLTLSHLYFE